MRRGTWLCAATVALAAAAPAAARERTASVAALFGDPAMPMLVVAHRACHNPAPRHGMTTSVPENSLDGIARCVRLGVDAAEVDVRRSRDGYLVLIHDETVDRTTDGHGKVAEMSLADIRKLHVRENDGGRDAPLTDRRVPLLNEALAAAKGRIVLNLDVQAGLYAETVAAVRRAGHEDGVIVKQPAGIGSPVLADTAPFDAIPFMPILTGDGDLREVAARQLTGRRRPAAFELPRMSAALLPGIATLARHNAVRLWANSLWEGFVTGMGGDVDALRDPKAVWGRMRTAGISVVQTDEPEALLAFLGR